MKKRDTWVPVLTDDVFLKSIIAEDLANKIIAGWLPEYGELIDFGGNEHDVLAVDLWRVAEGDAGKLSKTFNVPLKEAKAIISVLKRGIRNV
jgi:hypothetical protein